MTATPTVPKPAAPRGMTLVEVVVSIGVIAVLASMILPVVGAVRRSADAAVCASRLQQSGVAAGLYVSDHSGALPAFDYPRYESGEAEPIRVPGWGEVDHWVIVPFNEIVFWAYHLRPYVVDDPERDFEAAIEALCCPVPHAQWRQEVQDKALAGHSKPVNGMWPSQKSFMKSPALFTDPHAWSDRAAPPDLNRAHAVVRASSVRHPAAKSLLVERAAYHQPAPVHLVEKPPAARFNALAVDGHVSVKSVEDGVAPHGFVAAGSGLEVDFVDPTEFRDTGIWLLSTHQGAHGRDW